MARTATPAIHPRAQLYQHPKSTFVFVAPDLDEPGIVWTWRNVPDGWSTRDRYTASIEGLKSLRAWEAFKSDWPGARPLPKPPKVKPPKPPKPQAARLIACASTMMTIDEMQLLVIRAMEAGLTVSAMARRLIVAGLAASEPLQPSEVPSSS